jgi:hypothetical protein
MNLINGFSASSTAKPLGNSNVSSNSEDR